MEKKVLRTVQPAYKSDRVTVAQAKRAWLKVEGRLPEEGSVSTQGSDHEPEHQRSGNRS